MKKQVVIIGLGQFGMSMARFLSRHRVEVIAVDTKQHLIDEVSSFVSQAICLDATQESALAQLDPARRDVCVCAIGDEAREASIIVTALLKQLGAKSLIARATDELMERILYLVGATEVINPEKAFGERYARRILHSGIHDEVPLGDDLVITEISPQPLMIGKTLSELNLPQRFGLLVLGIQRVREGKSHVVMPSATRTIAEDDILIVVGAPGKIDKLEAAW